MKKAKTLEYKGFLIKNLKWLLIFGGLLGGLGGLYRIVTIQEEATGYIQEIDDTPQDNESSSDTRPSFFQFYIEREDGMVFYNSATVERFLNSEVTYEKILNDISIDLNEIKEEINEKNSRNDIVKPIRVSAEENTNVLTTIIESGDTRTNIELANYYHDYIFGENFDLFENNNVYLISKPQLVKRTNEESNNESPIQSPSNESNIKLDSSVFILAVIGFVGGAIVTLIILILKELKSEKLNYSFSYIFDDSDDFIIYDNTLKNGRNISRFIGIPYMDNKLLLSNPSLSNELQKVLLKNIRSEVSLTGNESEKMYLEFQQSLIDVPLKSHFNEIIIVVTAGETTRSWFEEEVKLSETYGVPVKVIHVNMFG